MRRFDRIFGEGEPPTPYISAWHQAPFGTLEEFEGVGRDDFALHLELFTIRRTSGKLKFLAGSESGMSVFINDVPPEAAAERLREVASCMSGKYLVTGGAGYVGSVVAAHLLEAGHEVVRPRRPLHRLPRGRPGGRRRSSRATSSDAAKWLDASFDGVLHFAAFSQVGESVVKPEKYWDNNVGGTMALLAAMRDAGRAQAGLLLHRRDLRRAGRRPDHRVRPDRADQPVRRHQARRRPHDHRRGGRARPGRGLAALLQRRGRLRRASGERHDPESHLIPLVLQVAQGRREAISVFGDDYPTPDGTCVRDYIHVADLAEAHLLALDAADRRRAPDLQPRQRQRLLRPRGHRDRPPGHRAPDPRGRRPRAAAATRPSWSPPPTRARERLGWNPSRADLAGIVADAWEFAQRTH